MRKKNIIWALLLGLTDATICSFIENNIGSTLLRYLLIAVCYLSGVIGAIIILVNGVINNTSNWYDDVHTMD